MLDRLEIAAWECLVSRLPLVVTKMASQRFSQTLGDDDMLNSKLIVGAF